MNFLLYLFKKCIKIYSNIIICINTEFLKSIMNKIF